MGSAGEAPLRPPPGRFSWEQYTMKSKGFQYKNGFGEKSLFFSQITGQNIGKNYPLK